jgi:hypothetical protein
MNILLRDFRKQIEQCGHELQNSNTLPQPFSRIYVARIKRRIDSKSKLSIVQEEGCENEQTSSTIEPVFCRILYLKTLLLALARSWRLSTGRVYPIYFLICQSA